MNRGSGGTFEGNAALAIASMRPRFMNRGSSVRGIGPDGPRLASMRPRFMNRGSVYVDESSPAGRISFNEAPIHESGK